MKDYTVITSDGKKVGHVVGDFRENLIVESGHLRKTQHLVPKVFATIKDDEERVVERLSQDSIVEALANVPHNFRDVTVLVDIGEFSYQDAAQILDIPVGTVMSRLHRGRRALKQSLAESTVGGS